METSPIPWTAWQTLGIALALFCAVPLGLYVRSLKLKKLKRHELLKALHAHGETEIVVNQTDGFSSVLDMEPLVMTQAIFELLREGIISQHERRAVRANQWERWHVYRLTSPKGTDLATNLFGTPPHPPEEEV